MEPKSEQKMDSDLATGIGQSSSSGVEGGNGVSQLGDSEQRPVDQRTVETVDVIRFSVPPYSGKLQTWFMRLEAQFRAARVTAQSVRFNIVIAQAPDSVSDRLTEDEIHAMSASRSCYDDLKRSLLRRCTPSDDERLSSLLREASVPSSERPSDIFRNISREAKDLLPEDTIKRIWLMKLPMVIQLMLLKEDLDISELVEIAYRYHEKGKQVETPLAVDAVRSNNPFYSLLPGSTQSSTGLPCEKEDPLSELTKMVKELKAEVCALKTDNRRDFRKRSGSRPRRSATPARRKDEQEGRSRRLCWYHDKFGNRAKDCKEPCDWVSEN